MYKFQVGVPGFGALYHFFREINTHTFGRFESCEQVSLCAAEFKHAQIWAHVKAKNFREALVIPFTQTFPRIPLAGNGIPMLNAGLLVGLTSRVKEVGFQHARDCT